MHSWNIISILITYFYYHRIIEPDRYESSIVSVRRNAENERNSVRWNNSLPLDWINESVKNRFLVARNEISFEVFAFEVSGGVGVFRN